MKQLLHIAITPEEIFDDEPKWIINLLENGWDIIHLRHPAASLRDMRRIIEAIPQCYHKQIRIHGHFELASELNLGGLHLNRRCPTPPPFYSGAVSRSCHSIEEVLQSTDCDYVTLSPIFDSVSKPGYNSAFSAQELLTLNDIMSPRVIALGGITPERLDELKQYNFSGIAVKGAIEQFLTTK